VSGAPFASVTCAPSVSITLRALAGGTQRFSVDKTSDFDEEATRNVAPHAPARWRYRGGPCCATVCRDQLLAEVGIRVRDVGGELVADARALLRRGQE